MASPRRQPIIRPMVVRILRALKRIEHWLVGQLVFFILWLLRLLPPDSAMRFADRAARRIGPWSGRHRVTLDNLRAAYPEKSEAEIEQIASDMWGNMARLGCEYVFLDKLFDFVPGSGKIGRVEVVGEDLFRRMLADPKPRIMFTAHTGNFELLPVAAAAFELPVTVLFRAPNNPYLADYVFSSRTGAMGGLLASRTGASIALARILEKGGNIGVLVDQKFNNGVPTTFFDRPCLTSPLLAKLARQFECDVHPTRAIRLPGNRFRLELHDKIDLPRDADGRVDVPATTQRLNDIVEGWVREHPGQWMWFHKRWQKK